MSRPGAVVLLSGGLDSATVLAECLAGGYDAHALTILYGQRHAVEREAARRVAVSLGVRNHHEFELDLRAFGGSALTSSLDVPKGRTEGEMTQGIPVTYVPARNTIFLSLALGWAESLGFADLFIGVNCVDYSGYPDCRPEFIQSFERMANLATRIGVEGQGRIRVHTPLILLDKTQIIGRARELGLDLGLTHSCYDPDPEGRGCRSCDACLIRLAAFDRLGLEDPAPYVSAGG
jgi:7-cyano-7-deazaguanine synthase